MLRISVSEQDPSCRIIKLEGKLLQAWVDEVRRLSSPRRAHFPASIFPDSVLSIVPAPNCCSSFCGKVFAFTLALRSWRRCYTGTTNQTLKFMGEWSSRLAFPGRSGRAR